MPGAFEASGASLAASSTLAQAHESLAALINNTPAVAIEIFDREGRIKLWNPAAETLFGFSAEEMIGQQIQHILLLRDEIDQFESDVARICDTGKAAPPAEWRVRRKDGALRDIFSSMFAMPLGDQMAVCCMAVDVTERKQAEFELGIREARLRLLTDQMPAIVWSTDRDLRFTSAAGAGLKALSLRVEDFRGKPIAAYFGSGGSDPWPALHAHRRALEGETLSYRRSWRGRNYRNHLEPLRDEAGAIIGCVGVAFDTTESENALRAQEESERRYQHLIETAEEGIWTLDAADKTTFVNRKMADLLGYTIGEMAGRSVYAFLDDEGKKLAGENLRKSRDGARSQSDFRFLRKDGSLLWTIISTNPFFDELGQYTGTLAMVTDITERKLSEERFRALFEHSSDGIILLDPYGVALFSGPSTQKLTGYSAEELVGREVFDFIHPDDRPEMKALFGNLLDGTQKSVVGNFRFAHKNGEWRWMEGVGTNLLSEPGINAIVANYRDITVRKAAEDQVRHQAFHDVLTGLPNRMLFYDRLTLSLAHAQRRGRGIAVVFFDLDHFKMINDTLGHAVGDVLLQEVAARLRQAVRADDTIARVGGDEYTLLLQDVSRAEDAAHIVEKIRERIDIPFEIGGHHLHMTASIGIAFYPSDGHDPESMIRSADNAMYRAKELGRNNFQMYTPEMNTRYQNRLALEEGLRQALSNDEFVIHYQPIYRVTNRHIVAVEALIRWNHPLRGLTGPDEFIPLAEETGLILPMGEWVLRNACRQVKKLQEDPDRCSLRLAVNLSVRQFQQADLVASISRILAETGFPASCLEIEITETIALQSAAAALRILQELRALGVRISLDDFGTGQSSLAYLSQFPIDTVKIDRTFIRDICTQPRDAAIASSVITLAHQLGLSVIAEGVESEDQLGLIETWKCDEMQGFFLSRPLSLATLTEMLFPG